MERINILSINNILQRSSRPTNLETMDKLIELKIKKAATARIVDVVGEYVELKRSGTDMVGLCPFHDDHKPSLHVNAAKGIWKCFACGVGGDAVEFVKMHEGCNYPEALQKLADMFNIYTDTNPYTARQPQVRPQMTKTEKPRQQAHERGYIPLHVVVRSLYYRGRLYSYLTQIIDKCTLESVWGEYCVGATRDGKEIFWGYTSTESAKAHGMEYGKRMNYGTDGHRIKGDCKGIHTQVLARMKKDGLWPQDYAPDFDPVLFGGQLIARYPGRPVAIVESEKSALVGACYLPQYTWCAVGGKDGLKAEMLAPCKGHDVYLYPDMDARQLWSDKAVELDGDFSVAVVQWWGNAEGLGEKADVADLLLREPPTHDTWAESESTYTTADDGGVPQYSADASDVLCPADDGTDEAQRAFDDICADNENVKRLRDALCLAVVDVEQIKKF